MDLTRDMILNVTKLVKEKNYDEAIVEAENLFGYQIKDYNLFVFAANAYINTARFEKAKECLLKGIALSPGKKVAYSGIIKMFDDKQIEASQDTLLAVDKLMNLEVEDPIKVSALTEKRSAMWLDLKMYDKLEDQLANINFLQKLLKSRAYIQFSAQFLDKFVDYLLKNTHLRCTANEWIQVYSQLKSNASVKTVQFSAHIFTKILECDETNLKISICMAISMLEIVIEKWYLTGVIRQSHLKVLSNIMIDSNAETATKLTSFKKSLILLNNYFDESVDRKMFETTLISDIKNNEFSSYPYCSVGSVCLSITGNYFYVDELIQKTRKYTEVMDTFATFNYYVLYGLMIEVSWFLNKNKLPPFDQHLCHKSAHLSYLYSLCQIRNGSPSTNEEFSQSKGNQFNKFNDALEQIRSPDFNILKFICSFPYEMYEPLLPFYITKSGILKDDYFKETLAILKQGDGNYLKCFALAVLVKDLYPKESWTYFSSSYDKSFFNPIFTRNMLDLAFKLDKKEHILMICKSHLTNQPLDIGCLSKISSLLLAQKDYSALRGYLDTFFSNDLDNQKIYVSFDIKEIQNLLFTYGFVHYKLGFGSKAVQILESAKDEFKLEENSNYYSLMLMGWFSEDKYLNGLQFYEDNEEVIVDALKNNISVFASILNAYVIVGKHSVVGSGNDLHCLKRIIGLLNLFNGNEDMNKKFGNIFKEANLFVLKQSLKLDQSCLNQVFGDKNEKLMGSKMGVSRLMIKLLNIDSVSNGEESNNLIKESCYVLFQLFQITQIREFGEECIKGINYLLQSGRTYYLIVNKAIVNIYLDNLNDALLNLEEAEALEPKNVQTYLLQFVVEYKGMKDSTSDNQLAEIARKCIHLNNDHPLVPLLAVITPLINKNTNATHDCHLWQATFAELVQASLRGFSLTSTLLYGYFNLILTDSGNEGDDWSYAFKSHFINAAAKNSSLSKEARHLISYSLQSLNDLEGALEILSIDDDSKFNELAIALRDAIGEGSEKSIYDSEKVFNEICSLDMKISKLFTLFFTEQNLEEFKKVMEPRYVGIILCYSIVAGIDLTKDMVEALEAYPRNVLLQALPFDNLETSVMMYLESAKVNVEKGNYLVTESSDDVNVLNISNQLKICYLNKFCQSELC